MLFSGIYKDTKMVICALENSELKTVYDLLKDSSITKSYPNLLLTSSSLDLPYLISEDATDFSNVFEVLNDDNVPSDDVILAIKSVIDPIKTLSVEEYKLLHQGFLALKKYFTESKVEIDFPTDHYDNFRSTKDIVDRVQKKSTTFNVSDNKTLFRDNENSELFIMVPSPDSLTLSEDASSFIPNMKNVFVPFQQRELYGYNYKNYLKQYGVTAEAVLGDPSNNSFEIYPEEERYYNALKELHDSLMGREHPDNTVEECVKYGEYSDLFKNYISLMLTEALRYHRNHSGFISLNSYVDDEESNDDDNDSDSSNTDSLSVNLFYSNNKKGNFDGEELINSLVEDQIKKDVYAPIRLLIQALRFGSKLPSKLELSDNRFFDLKDFSYSNLSGSFANYAVRKTALGNNYSVLGVVNTNNRIKDTSYCNGVGFSRPKLNSPVGLVLEKRFENSEERQLVLISMVDLVRFIDVDKTLTIDGISKSNGSIIVDESILSDDLLDNSSSIDEIVSRLNYPQFISYINPAMKGDYLECGCFNKSLSQLELLKNCLIMDNLKQLNLFVVVGKDDVFDKVKSYRLSPNYLLDLTMSYYLLDLTIKADNMIYDLALNKFSYSMSDVVSIYSQVINDCNYPLGVYSEEYDGYSNDDLSKTSSPSMENNSEVKNNEIKDSSVFGSATTNKVEEKKEEPRNNDVSNEGESGNMYNLNNLFYNGDFEQVIPIVLPKSVVQQVNLTYKELNQDFAVKEINSVQDLSVVGYLTQVNGTYVLLEPKAYDKPSKGKFTLTKFKANILGILRVIASGSVPKVKFDSFETLEYYCKILEKC